MTRRMLPVALMSLLGCGIGSVSPVITESSAVNDSRLRGTWHGETGKSGLESVVISLSGRSGYDILYTDEDGKSGRFNGRLGKLGPFNVLDIQPVEPLPDANDSYKSLLLRAHGIVIIDSISDVIQFRILEPDSLKAYLEKRPQAVSHAFVDDNVLLTAPSDAVRRFFVEYLSRTGALGERNIWRRALP